MANKLPTKVRSLFSKRRLVLLASVAAIGAGVMLAGPSYPPLSMNGTPAHADVASAQAQPGFADLIDKVKPAVISVRVKIEDQDATNGSGLSSEEQGGDNQGDNQGLQRFFRQFGMPDGQNMPNFRSMPRHRTITGQGSGFFISADGYAVTNFHVVDHAKTVQIQTDAGKTYTAKVVGSDQKTDLALIKVDGDNSFPFVQLSDKQPRVGDWVIAVGNPFGLAGTATAGIVSARGRDIGAGPYDDFIQIDAPINKGNSGGPAFNTDGKVIAVNTAIYSPSGGSVGIGFAVPSGTAKPVIDQLREFGEVRRGWLGVRIQNVDADMAEALGLDAAKGALITDVPEGPAAKAGLIGAVKSVSNRNFAGAAISTPARRRRGSWSA